jgi:potassium efflux system protein
MHSIRTLSRIFILGLMMSLGLASAQEIGLAPPTAELIETRIGELVESPSLTSEVSIQAYQEALAALGRKAEAHEREEALIADAAGAPAMMKALEERSAAARPGGDLELPSTLSLDDEFQQAQSNLVALRMQLAEYENKAALSTKRKAELPEEITQAQQKRKAAEESLLALAPGEEQQARRVLLLAQIEEYRAIHSALETRRTTYEVRRDLLIMRRDRTQREALQTEERVAALQKRVDASRTAEGDLTAKSAENRSESITARFPELAMLAEQTQLYLDKRSGETGLPRRISSAQSAKEQTRAQLEEVRARFRAARRRASVGEMSEGMGLILRWDHERLATGGELRASANQLEKKLSGAQLELIETEDARYAMADLNGAAVQHLQELNVGAPATELREATHELFGTQREAHDALIADLETLTAELFAHKELTRSIAKESNTYREFIENRILWVRSSSSNPIHGALAIPGHLSELRRALVKQFSLKALDNQARTRWVQLVALAALLIGLIAVSPRLKLKRLEHGELVRSHRTDKFRYTLHALGLTVLLAVRFPITLWTLGWLLSGSEGLSEELPRAAGQALREISVVWLFFRLLSELAKAKSLGPAHFKWNAGAMSDLRRELRWFEPLALLLGFVVLFFDRQSDPTWANSVGRLCFIGSMILMALLAHRLFRAKNQIWPATTGQNGGLFEKTRGVLAVLAYVLPTALALLAICGYYYTALQFELRLRYSIGFGSSLVMVNAVLLRWLFVTRRRLAVEQALEAKAQRELLQDSAGLSENNTLFDAEKIDIPAIDAQTRRLFKTSISLASMVGLFVIWAGVLPALRGLDRVQLLPEFSIVSSNTEVDQPYFGTPSGTQTNAETAGASTPAPSTPGSQLMNTGTTSGGTTDQQGLPSKLTLADVLIALLFTLLTSVAAKNLPALLELSVLVRLPMDSGTRYAVSTIVRYLILIIGVSAISGALGIGWQKVQWLAAALTFGLAFGLQEIFANFVSGLIILIERPIRVGDIVTVGGTEGRVTQLRMRATTILDWDRREYLVPNKEFITGSIVNWTLSDPVTRLKIPVGIAYGSDTEKARELLLKAAAENPTVLVDPEPTAIFRSFGSSSLDFELLVFIANRDLWPRVIDQIHSDVDHAFRKAKIEIAFPQCDLHIRSAEGLHEGRPGDQDTPPSTNA